MNIACRIRKLCIFSLVHTVHIFSQLCQDLSSAGQTKQAQNKTKKWYFESQIWRNVRGKVTWFVADLVLCLLTFLSRYCGISFDATRLFWHHYSFYVHTGILVELYRKCTIGSVYVKAYLDGTTFAYDSRMRLLERVTQKIAHNSCLYLRLT